MGKKNLISNSYKGIVTSYWFWADQFLMTDQVEDGILWMINNFINIKYNPDWFPSGVYFANNEYRNKMVEFYDCPFFRTQKIFFDADKKILGENIINFAISNIDRNRFVLLRVDRYYLGRGKTRNEHEILLHGYDKQERKFYYADNGNTGKFITDISCSFNELEKALASVQYFADEPDLSDSIFTFEVYKNQEYSLNIEKILFQLNQYLSGEKLSFDGLYYNGITFYDALIKYFRNEIVGMHSQYDWRGLTVIKDHKLVMVERIRYLAQKFNYSFLSLDQYIDLANKCNILVMLYLKYGFKKDREILKRIVEMLQTIKEIEKKTLQIFIYELKSLL